MTSMGQLIVAPILLPLLTAAVMLLLGEKHRQLKARLNLLSTVTGLAIAICLLLWVRTHGQAESIGVYLPATGLRLSASCWCSITSRHCY